MMLMMSLQTLSKGIKTIKNEQIELLRKNYQILFERLSSIVKLAKEK